MLRKKGFTLVELAVVVVIVGILAVLSLNFYGRVQEQARDREAQGELKLLRAAQRNYRMDELVYYPDPAASTSDHAAINANLRVSLPTSGDPRFRPWNFQVRSDGCSQATRNGSDGRIWSLRISDADGEPDPGGCS